MLAFRVLIAAAVALSLAPASAQPPEHAQVTGFGGFFFRADDPKALAAWYRENLGIKPVPDTYEEDPWQQEAGPTVFAPFPKTSTSFGDVDKGFTLNFRTRDLDALVAHLRAKGSVVTVDEKIYPNGRFAGLDDPEGNPIQLWEPAEPGR